MNNILEKILKELEESKKSESKLNKIHKTLIWLDGNNLTGIVYT